MRVITQHRFGGPEVLEIAQRPAVEPGSGQVAVTTTAAGVNPVDAVVRSGAFPLLGNPHSCSVGMWPAPSPQSGLT